MIIRKSFMISLFVVALAACQTDPDAPSNMPQAPSVQVEEETLTRVGTAVRVTFSGVMADVTVYGVELTDKLFEAGGEIKTLYPETVTEDGFLLSVAGLEPNTNYYLRAFVANGMSKIYSKVITFSTPETSVASVSDVRLEDGMFLTATIEDSGGRSIEDFGFVWGETDDRRSLKRMKRTPGTMGDDGKTFTLPLSALGVGLHYVLAYAEDEKSATGFSRIPHMEDLRPDQAVQFEDPNFERYVVSRFDADGNGKISYAEMSVIESIEVTTDNIRSVREISLMKDLHSLMVTGSGMKDNTSSIGKGMLTKLDISANEMLSYVNCSYNAFTSLDFSGNMNLRSISCLGNPMEVLYLSRKQEIETLEVPEGCRIVYVDDEPEEPISASFFMKFMSEGETTLSLTNEGGNAPTLYYSTDRETWAKWDYSALTFTEQQPLFLCGDNPDGFSKSKEVYSTFTASGSPFLAEGNIMSLLNKDEEIYEVPAYCFFCAFYNCQQLSFISMLPAETLSQGCYYRMFTNCSSLTSAPYLPATTLADACYYGMFDGCTSLMYAPELKAAALADNCYNSMFYGCTSLTTAPELPATTLVGRCYDHMFADCTSLTTAPELPATALTDYCYFGMFRGCTNLESAPELPATTLVPYCYSQMFGSCSNLRYIKCLATDISAEMCVGGWTVSVAQQGTFVRAAGMQDWPTGTSGIPGGWTVEVDGEEPVGFEAVDLGLSVMWGNMNIGASTPEDYGGHYAWGETETKENYSLETYKWCDGVENSYTKYNNSIYQGTADGKTVLEASDDVAHVVLGGNWRMPTYTEWWELSESCTWKWTTKNNVKGYLITSNTNGASIFLPAAGYLLYTSPLDLAGSDGFYWSSTLYPDNSSAAWYCRKDKVSSSISRIHGLSVRPVYSDIVVTSIELDMTELWLTEGEAASLTATLSPDNAGNKSVTWTSSNESVATVAEGVVTAVAAGEATITVSAGNISTACAVNVNAAVDFEAVDMGLSVKWGNKNMGAKSPERYGGYYAWGETETKENYSTYKWRDGDYGELLKYNTMSLYGTVDNKVVLDAEDDVATVTLGDKWRMPTNAEWKELRENCTWTWTTQNGEEGQLVTSNINGESIFLPAAGYRDKRYLSAAGSSGYYWSSSLYGEGPTNAYYLSFSSTGSGSRYNYRGYGQSVRPVYGDAPVESMNPIHWLTFTSEGTTTLGITNYIGNAPTLYYSTDKKTWIKWDYSEITFTANMPLYLCGDNPDGFSKSYEIYSTFTASGSPFHSEGSIMSLVNKDDVIDTVPSWCFYYAFSDCSLLKTAPQLPATTLAERCYCRMFEGCTGLTTAPELSATTLAGGCYYYMFSGCTGLTTAPELPATTLAESCYSGLFVNCSSLASAPELPATILAENCYNTMFVDCNSLTSAPELPATTLAEGCYCGMFNGCTGLTLVPELPATTLAESCYCGMFEGCTGLTIAPELPATTLETMCYGQMFYGCSSLTSAPELPATTLAEHCYERMFSYCSSLTSAPELPATTLAWYCYQGMFSFCSSLTSAPELPATTLLVNCYAEMFSYCRNLSYIKCLATDISASKCLALWVEEVSQQGTFVKAATMTSWPSGVYGIPNGWTVEDAEEPAGGN